MCKLDAIQIQSCCYTNLPRKNPSAGNGRQDFGRSPRRIGATLYRGTGCRAPPQETPHKRETCCSRQVRSASAAFRLGKISAMRSVLPNDATTAQSVSSRTVHKPDHVTHAQSPQVRRPPGRLSRSAELPPPATAAPGAEACARSRMCVKRGHRRLVQDRRRPTDRWHRDTAPCSPSWMSISPSNGCRRVGQMQAPAAAVARVGAAFHHAAGPPAGRSGGPP